MRQLHCCGVLGAALVLLAAAASDPPQAQAPARKFYTSADPVRDIAAALTRAQTDGKHVLLDFGADWCPDCVVLGALFESETVAPVVAAAFHVVHVDVGHRDKNAELVAKYRATSDDWIPALVVLDGKGTTIAITDRAVRVTRRTTPSELKTLLEGWAPKKSGPVLHTFTERSTRVEIALDRDLFGSIWLAGTFTPAEPDLYLYSVDLPQNGIEGLGRPTRLAVGESPQVRILGRAVANRPVQIDRIEALKLSLRVYPTGPVTLRVPIELPAGTPARADLSVGYMTCGPNGCLPPVDRRFAVTLR